MFKTTLTLSDIRIPGVPQIPGLRFRTQAGLRSPSGATGLLQRVGLDRQGPQQAKRSTSCLLSL